VPLAIWDEPLVLGYGLWCTPIEQTMVINYGVVLSLTFGGTIVTLTGLVVLLSPTIDPSLAGLALAFASMISFNVSFLHRSVGPNFTEHCRLGDVLCEFSDMLVSCVLTRSR
jgi:hypothetical protein